MTWNPATSCGNESAKCRFRLMPYLYGTGLDLGCGLHKIHRLAIGVDRLNSNRVDIKRDVRDLSIFADDSMDYVFSSHCLEDIKDTEATLGEWWRVLKVGGYLVLYLPHRDLYPNIGSPGTNVDHRHDFVPEDIIEIVRDLFDAELVHNQTHDKGNEYSFDLVFKKLDEGEGYREDIFEPSDKDVMVVRYGAYGDMLQITPLLRHLKEQGYRVIVQTSRKGTEILQHHPCVDRLERLSSGVLPGPALIQYLEYLRPQYSRFINLNSVVEETLLHGNLSLVSFCDRALRERLCNLNYVEAMFLAAGEDPALAAKYLPEIRFSEEEDAWAQKFIQQFRDAEMNFIVVWGITGSGWHKTYRYSAEVMEAWLTKHPDSMIIVTGGKEELVPCWVWQGPRVLDLRGKITMRNSMNLCMYADLVMGVESAMVNAAACFEVPKIVMLSHSSPENLTKHWVNVRNIEPDCSCYPCHRLHDGWDSCGIVQIEEGFGPVPACIVHPPEHVLELMQEFYDNRGLEF